MVWMHCNLESNEDALFIKQTEFWSFITSLAVGLLNTLAMQRLWNTCIQQSPPFGISQISHFTQFSKKV